MGPRLAPASASAVACGPRLGAPGVTAMDELHLATLVADAHRQLVETGGGKGASDAAELEAHVRSVAPLVADAEVDRVVAELTRRLDGFGPLDELLRLDDVSEVMVNGPGPVWIERGGRLERTDVVIDPTGLQLLIDRIVTPLGLRIDRLVPFVDARLPDGSRAHVTIPPMAVDGPHVTIRRFQTRAVSLSSFGSPSLVAELSAAVRERVNVVVTGGTGAGKTTLIGALAASFGRDERIITIEDTAELRLPGRHVVRLEARRPNAEGAGELTVRTLLRNALRMRPDRLVVGEVRGAEALEMIQALNTGHAGSLSTCHANSASDGLDRLTTMALMGDVGLPADLVRAQLESVVDLLVHVERTPNGQRKIVEVLDLRTRAGA